MTPPPDLNPPIDPNDLTDPNDLKDPTDPKTPPYSLLELIRDRSAPADPEPDTPAVRFLSVPPRSVWPD